MNLEQFKQIREQVRFANENLQDLNTYKAARQFITNDNLIGIKLITKDGKEASLFCEKLDSYNEETFNDNLALKNMLEAIRLLVISSCNERETKINEWFENFEITSK